MKLTKNNTIDLSMDRRYLIPSIISAGVIPLLMRTHVYQTHLTENYWFPSGSAQAVDIFLWWKMLAIIAVAVLMVCFLLHRKYVLFEDLRWERPFFCLAGYEGFVFLSAIFAKSPLFAWAGGYEMFESAPVIFGYGIICYYTYTSIQKEEHAWYLLKWAGLFAGLVLLIGVFQGFDKDLFKTKIGKMLISSPSWWKNLDSISVTILDSYSTLYNPNYFSMYLALLIPITVVVLAILAVKKNWKVIFPVILLVMEIMVLKFNGSASGILGLFFGTGLGVVILSWRKKKLGIVLTLAAVLCVCASIGAYLKNDSIHQKVTEYTTNYPSTIQVDKITTGKKDVRFDFKDGRALRISYDVDANGIMTVKVMDKDKQELPVIPIDENAQVYQLQDAESYYGCQFTRAGDGSNTPFYLTVTLEGLNRSFIHGLNEKDNSYYYLTSFMSVCKLPTQKVEKEYFYPSFMSGRGYIYNKTIPELKHHLILGAGANNYMLAVPQLDRFKYIETMPDASIDVKPHCNYMMEWIQEGFLGFACFMAFIVWTLFIMARSLIKTRKMDTKYFLLVGGYIALLSYYIVVLANDSNVCTSPVFWTVNGMALGLAKLVGENDDKNVDDTAR
jgi:hypothetical protein